MKSRTTALTAVEQSAFVNKHIPHRIAVIEQGFVNKPNPSYADMTAAAVFSRTIASFLGIGVRRGQLKLDSDYFEHAKGQSWEVKITDIAGGTFVDLRSLSVSDQTILLEGLTEVNLAFTHLTFWSSRLHQTPGALPTAQYNKNQQEKLRAMGALVVRLYRRQSTLFRV